nr:Elongation factor 4 [Klebsiella pneumoniae]
MSLVRIKNGTMRKGDKIKVMSTGRSITLIVWASSPRNRLTVPS